MEKLFDAEKGGISLGSCKRRALEGYGVDIVLIFTRDGAPSPKEFCENSAVKKDGAPSLIQ